MNRAIIVAALVAVAGGSAGAVGACSIGDLDLENRGCPCGSGYVCDAKRDLCVRAEALLDAAVFEEASVVADAAVPGCTTSPDSCGVGSYCLPTHECAPGCKASSECAALSPTSPFCNTQRHQCVQCVLGSDCAGGLQCSPAGSCVATCAGQGAPCADGKSTCCNNLCIDTKSDVLNCNGCGTACTGVSTLCCAGTCTDPLTSPANCGKCGAPCDSKTNATASTCAAGACAFTCTTGFGHCATGNTGCETSTTANVSKCGGCANDCNVLVKNATGISCQASKCGYTSCNAGFSELDGKTYDGCEACGMRGQYCCPGNVCLAGAQCEPAPANDGKCH